MRVHGNEKLASLALRRESSGQDWLKWDWKKWTGKLTAKKR